MATSGHSDMGAMVSARRCELAMSRQQLAQRAGVSLTTISNFESGIIWPRPVTRARLETALGWPQGALNLGGSETVPPQVKPTESSDASLAPYTDADDDGRQVELLPERLAALTRHGLTAASRYAAILLDNDDDGRFRR